MNIKKTINPLGNISPDQVSRFITKKWIETYDESGGTYSVYKGTGFKYQC